MYQKRQPLMTVEIGEDPVLLYSIFTSKSI